MAVRRVLLAGLASVAAMLAALPDAGAIPAFARKHNVNCGACHVAFPYLNGTGQRFRIQGYQMPELVPDQEPNRAITPAVVLDPAFPISAHLMGWAFQSTNESHARVRPISEAELLAAGVWWTKGSFFIDAGAGDEDNFVPTVGAQLGYHPLPWVNLLGGTKGPFHPDPFNTFRDPLTLFPRQASERVAGPDELRPTLELYGLARSLYYAAALSVAENDALGERPWVGFGRVAYYLDYQSTVGAFVVGGGAGPPREKLLRAGADFNVLVGDLYLLGMAAMLRGESPGAVTVDATGFLEALYLIREGFRVLGFPLLRIGYDTFDDAAEHELGLTGGFFFQPVDNARVGVEGTVDLVRRESGSRVWGAGLDASVAF